MSLSVRHFLRSVFAVWVFTFCSAAFAQEGDSAASAPAKLRWGADIKSGAPYAYKSPEDPEKVVGFEAEFVEALAHELGMQVQFVQNSWDGLVEGLKRGDYDIVVNGLEITPERAKEVHFSQAYYVTAEALTVRKSNNDIQGLADLKSKRVGTLAASLAAHILEEQKFPIQIVP